MNNKNYFFPLVLILVFLVALAYSNHFQNSFHFDDSHSIQGNVSIRSIDVVKFFSDASTITSLPANQSYRPLLTTILSVEYWLGQGTPLWFHIGAFSAYIMLWVLLFLFFRKVFSLALPNSDHSIASLLGASFYILHAANAETVNYLSAQSDLISTTFMVASLVLFALRPDLRKFGFYLVPAALAMFTKEVSAIFGLFVLAYVSYERSFSLVEKEKEPWQCFKAALPTISLCIAMLAFSGSMLPKTFHPSNIDRLHYLLAQPFVILHYFSSFFLPLNLSADTDWEPITNAADTRVLVGLAFIALMLAVAIRAWRKNETRPISFGIWWFIVGVSPTSSGVVVLSEVMNDHRMFLPFIGLAIAATWSVLRLVEIKWQPTFAALIAILLSGHSYGTFQRNKVWKDEESLWYDVTIKSPRNGRGLMNYGLSLMAKGQIKEALYYFDRARQFAPNYAYLHINTAIALDQLGDLPKAEEYFNKAISTNPNYAGCYYYYSRFLDKHERFDEAIQLLDKSLKVAPTFAESRYLLMRIHAKRKDWQGLRTVAEDTLKVWPHDDQASSFRQIALTAANDQKPDSF